MYKPAMIFCYFCFLSMLLIAVNADYDGAGSSFPVWSYDNSAPDGPDSWHNLAGYSACAGSNQSPIALYREETKPISEPLALINFNSYKASNITITNDGHTVDITFTFGSNNLQDIPYINGGLLNANYRLAGFHFHWGSKSSQGSEHTINGYRYPMEGHFVHINEKYADFETAQKYKDGVSVIGYMFTISGNDNKYLNSLLNNFQYVQYKDQVAVIKYLNLYNLLPTTYKAPYFTYRGSLTTPPCSETVIWNVYTNLEPISERQMKFFRTLQKETKANNPHNNMPLVDNFRALQATNGREILFYQPRSG